MNESTFPLKTCHSMNDSVDLKFGTPLTSLFGSSTSRFGKSGAYYSSSLPYILFKIWDHMVMDSFFREAKLIWIVLLHDQELLALGVRNTPKNIDHHLTCTAICVPLDVANNVTGLVSVVTKWCPCCWCPISDEALWNAAKSWATIATFQDQRKRIN